MGWFLVGLGCLVLLGATFHFVLSARRRERFRRQERLTAEKLHLNRGPDRIDATPDRPVPFGYKITWLAVPTEDPEEVVRSLQLEGVERANWLTGRNAAYSDDGRLFVSPVVHGWVLAVGSSFPGIGHPPHELQWTGLMRSLSQKFGEVQYFATHRVVGFCAWSRWIGGQVQRSYAYSGESGKTLLNRGEQTVGEAELGYHFFDETLPEAKSEEYRNRSELTHPNEMHVMEVAGKWSINPTKLDKLDLGLGAGWVGRIGVNQLE